LAAHQGVHRVVEELRVAEVERQRLMTAAVEVGVGLSAPADRERVRRHAVHHHREADALRLAEPPGVSEDPDRRRRHRCAATGSEWPATTERIAWASRLAP